MRNIKELSREELERFVAGEGFRAFHARQIVSWVYGKHAADFTAMSNVPLKLRESLARSFVVSSLKTGMTQLSADGTKKLLFVLPDNERVEGVIIPAARRTTGCVSTQAGCKYSCAFCASGAAGFRRNLTCAEILDEVVLLAAAAPGGRLTNVVFMGTGEPFDNYDNVVRAIRVINDPGALGIGARRITISTCGIIPGIERFSREGLQVELSVSLHAADDALRARLMPVNRKYPLKDLIAACRTYAATTRRQVTFEYIMLGGVNSDLHSARKLATLLKGFDAKVNLIPYNPAAGAGFHAPEKGDVLVFGAQLKKEGVLVTVRSPRGTDIAAACGQLRLVRSRSGREQSDEEKN